MKIKLFSPQAVNTLIILCKDMIESVSPISKITIKKVLSEDAREKHLLITFSIDQIYNRVKYERVKAKKRLGPKEIKEEYD